MLTKNTQKVKRRVTIIALLLALLFLASPKTVFAGELSNQFSLGMWVRPGTSVASKALLGKAEEMRLATDASGNPLCQIKATTWQTAATSSVALVLNTWAFVACTYDKVTLRVYVNGVQTGSQALTTAVDDTSAVSKIGQDDSASTPYANFIGTVDQLQVYNYARTSKQIVEDMNGGHPAGGSPVGSQIGYWKFDEGYGTTANNQISGQPNFTFANAPNDPTWDNNGKFGKTVYFDGALSVTSEDYADATYTTQTWDDGTLSVWIKPDSIPAAEYYPISDYNGVVGESGGWLVAITSNGGCSIRGNASYNSSCPANTFQGNQWTHITWVVSKTQGFLKTYANGKLINTVTGNALGFRINTTLRVGMGSWCGTGSDCIFPGFIDELKLYNSALTEDEIKLDYNRGAAMVLGTMSDTSQLTGGSVASSSAQAQYCIPGDTASCNGPVGEWNFEEGTGSSAQDSSSNSLTGTITNATWTQGKYGKGLKFTNSGDKVVVTHNTTVDFSSNSFTVTAWVKNIISQSADYAGIIAKETNWGPYTGWWLGVHNNGTLTFQIDDATNQNSASIATANLNDGNWHFLTAIVDRTANTITVYRDTTKSTPTAITAVDIDAGDNLEFGEFTGSSSRRVTGKIDQVRIFNYARTPAQIAWDYNRGVPVAHYKFDECQGSTANDSSGNGNAGTITIGATGSQTAVGTCATSGAWFNGVTGKYNSSLNFDGTDDYASKTSPSNLPSGANPFSTSLWLKSSSGTSNLYVLKWGTPATKNMNAIIYYGGTNSVSHAFYAADLSSGANTITSGAWNHILVTFDGTTRRIYINGKETANDAPTSINVTANQTLWLATYAGSSNFFPGQIDDVRIYNYPLTAVQVKNLYNNGALNFGPSTGSP